MQDVCEGLMRRLWGACGVLEKCWRGLKHHANSVKHRSTHDLLHIRSREGAVGFLSETHVPSVVLPIPL